MESLKTPIIIMLILGILGMGYYISFYNPIPKTIIEECKNPPMINSYFDSWGENINNEEESIFNYWIYNYGDREVKNITIRCKTWDSNDNLILSETDFYGNIASNTIDYGESIFNTPKIKDNEFIVPLGEYGEILEETGICYIESCDDCKILWKEIPSIREGYDETEKTT